VVKQHHQNSSKNKTTPPEQFKKQNHTTRTVQKTKQHHQNSSKTKHKIGICCFSTKHAALRRKSKDWLAQKQDNSIHNALIYVPQGKL
jgi:hypothetical protein